MTAALAGRDQISGGTTGSAPAAAVVEAAKVYLSTRRAADRHRAAAAVIKRAVHGETLVDLGLGLVTGIWRKRRVLRLPAEVAEKVEALEAELEALRVPHRISEPRGSYSWQLVLKVPAECHGPGEWFEIGEVSDAEIEALEDDPGRMFSWPARCTRDPQGGSTDRILDSRAQDSIHGGSEVEEGLIFVRLDEG